MEKMCGSQRGGPPAGNDLMAFLRFLEGVHPLWTVIIGPFGRATVTDSIISKRPLSMCLLGSFDYGDVAKKNLRTFDMDLQGLLRPSWLF